jgi:hypothetical protein
VYQRKLQTPSVMNGIRYNLLTSLPVADYQKESHHYLVQYEPYLMQTLSNDLKVNTSYLILL